MIKTRFFFYNELNKYYCIPNGPLQVGQQVSFGRQLLHTR